MRHMAGSGAGPRLVFSRRSACLFGATFRQTGSRVFARLIFRPLRKNYLSTLPLRPHFRCHHNLNHRFPRPSIHKKLLQSPKRQNLLQILKHRDFPHTRISAEMGNWPPKKAAAGCRKIQKICALSAGSRSERFFCAPGSRTVQINSHGQAENHVQ
jgi:hypothetical protein